MIKLLLLFAIAFMSCNVHNDPPGDTDKAEKVDETLYSTIKQEQFIKYYPEQYYVSTRIWVGKKEHDKSSISLEYDALAKCTPEILEATKKLEHNKALKVKFKIDSVLYIKNADK